MFFMISKRKILKIDLRMRERREREDRVAIDKPVDIFVNGRHITTLMASPKNLKELGIGYLFGEKIISGLEDIKRLSTKGAKTDVQTGVGTDFIDFVTPKVIPTACGASRDVIEQMRGWEMPRPKSTGFKAEYISNAFKLLQSKSKVYRKTGGTHVAALFTRGGVLKFVFEDVGRHNAVDKIIGRGLLEGTDSRRSFLILSGRLSADIVGKCARAGIPLVASKAAPLESGILAAEMSGLTLVGFVRGPRLNVYAGSERVKF